MLTVKPCNLSLSNASILIELVLPQNVLSLRQTAQLAAIRTYFGANIERIQRELVPFISNTLGSSVKRVQLSNERQLSVKTRRTKNSRISGRLLDYLVTTYSKKTFCVYNDDGRDVRTMYRAALSAAGGRCNFDPFSRKAYGVEVRVAWQEPLGGVNEVISTVAQLNFIRWYFISGVSVYVTNHHQAIAEDMTLTYRRVNKEKHEFAAAGVKRKRQPLIGNEDDYGVLLYEGTTTVKLLS
jgi:hypothetical protein